MHRLVLTLIFKTFQLIDSLEWRIQNEVNSILTVSLNLFLGIIRAVCNLFILEFNAVLFC